MNRFYVTEKLSEHIGETPEGFLVCYDVPIARIGEQVYKGDEVPIEPNEQGLVTIKRTEGEVFKPEAIQSFEGKPFTIDHPDEMVTPENWKTLAHGFIANVRKGLDDKLGLIIGDIVATTKDVIELIKSGMREISCGYDADYEQLEKGVGIQKNIIGNHIALVMKGRAGHRCAIGDKECNHCGCCHDKNKVEEDDDAMKFKDKLKATYRKLMKDKAFRDADEEEQANKLAEAASNAVEEEGLEVNDDPPAPIEEPAPVEAPPVEEPVSSGGEVTNAELKDMLARMLNIIELFVKGASGAPAVGDKKMKDEEAPAAGNDLPVESAPASEEKPKVQDEGSVPKPMPTEEEAKPFEADEDPEEKEEKAAEEAKTCDSVWYDIAYRADLLYPGINLVKPTKDHMAVLTKIKKRALNKALTTDAETVSVFVKGDIDKMNEQALDVAFVAVSEAIKNKNNKFVTDSLVQNTKGVTNDIKSIQKRNKEFWNKDKK